MNRELYTSLVINARTIATTGGTKDQNVAYTAGCAASSAARTVTGQASINNATTARTADTLLRLRFIIDFLPRF